MASVVISKRELVAPMAEQHIPVLLEEVVRSLHPHPEGIYIDGTVGRGGHAAAIMDGAGGHARLLGLDADPRSLTLAGETLAQFGNAVALQEGNFRHIAALAEESGFARVDGILLDLGISSMQLDATGRGFSFQDTESLDMRFSPRQQVTALDLVNTCPESALADLIYRYGEERQSRRIARTIVARRPITTAAELAAVVSSAMPRRGKIHPATRTFQALRIAVNDELDALREALPQALGLLTPGGILAVISFHSLEDRIVKELFQREARDCVCPPSTPVCVCDHKAQVRLPHRRPIAPTPEEVNRNPRSRSAKLRVAEKL